MNEAIGVFDSGLGGLTVLRELISTFPNENYLYLGDTARLPYGSKSPEVIRRYTQQNIDFLLKKNVKAIVVACNSASSVLEENVQSPIPIYNVITPGAEKALRLSQTKRIGILGTRATIASRAYNQRILKQDLNVDLFEMACPLFVPLAEEGLDLDPITNLIAFRYIHPLLEQKIDTLILGCTHYPLLKGSIQRVTQTSVQLVDSGTAVAEDLAKDFASGKLVRRAVEGAGELHVLTTDFSKHFENLTRKIMDIIPLQTVEVVEI